MLAALKAEVNQYPQVAICVAATSCVVTGTVITIQIYVWYKVLYTLSGR